MHFNGDPAHYEARPEDLLTRLIELAAPNLCASLRRCPQQDGWNK